MIETAIHLLIGFLLASLLALVAMPAISRRAHRLAERQARMLAPLSATQATADRDALRGQHAIKVLEHEWRYEVAEKVAALAQIELGRRAREIADHKNEIVEKSAEIARQSQEIEHLRQALLERDVEIASREMALLDLTHQRDAAASRLADAQTRVDDHEVTLEPRRAEVASLEARILELGSALSERERAFETAALGSTSRLSGLTDKLVTKQSSASRLESQVFELESRNAALRTETEGRATEMGRPRRRPVGLERRLSESEKLPDELAMANGPQTMRTSEREAELSRMKASHREEVNRFQDRLSGAVARENELTMRVQALIASRIEAESAMRAALAELTSFRERLAKAEKISTSAAIGDANLRRSITRLGRDLAEILPAYGNLTDAELVPFRGRGQPATSILRNDDDGPSPMVTGG